MQQDFELQNHNNLLQSDALTHQTSQESISKNNGNMTKRIEIEEKKEVPLQTIGEKVLDRDFFTVDHLTLAKNLLGKVLVRRFRENQVIKCRIVETEAYGGDDGAFKNSYHGKYTERTKPLWMEGGHLYISLVHGLHHCLNFSAAGEGELAAVLVRAIEIIEGFDLAVQNRNLKNSVSKLGKEVTNGPGKVCAALKIDKKMSGYNATKPGEVYVVDQDFNSFNIIASKRINIDYAGESVHNPWRFYIENNRFISCKGEVLEVIVPSRIARPDEIHETVSEVNRETNIKECPSISFLDKFKFGKK